jgi:hypothetical protein
MLFLRNPGDQRPVTGSGRDSLRGLLLVPMVKPCSLFITEYAERPLNIFFEAFVGAVIALTVAATDKIDPRLNPHLIRMFSA